MFASRVSISVSVVAQSVTKRTGVWLLPLGPQSSNDAMARRESIFSFGRMKNCWFVGESMYRGYPLALKPSLSYMAISTACLPIFSYSPLVNSVANCTPRRRPLAKVAP